MQITINQSEIETAIKEYLSKRVTIEDGLEIVIDLKASRGPEGYTASIDLVEPSSVQAPTPEAAPAPTPRKPRQLIANQAQPATVVTPTAPEPAQEAAGQAQAEQPAADPATDTEASSGSETAQEQAEEEAPAPTTPPKSLFGNLKRPNNA